MTTSAPSSGNLYVTSAYSGVVSKITNVSGTPNVTTTWATVGSTPDALAFDSSGNLYTANAGSNTISKVTSGGSVTKTWATVGGEPWALAIDASNNVYTANNTSGTVSKVTSGGSVTTTFASVGTYPDAIAFNPSGNLYTASDNNPGTVSEILAVSLPGTPGTPSFSSVTGTSLTVSWTNGIYATSTNIYRCSGASCTPTLYQSGVAGTSYNDTGLTQGTSYTYYIVNANSAGTGPASASNSVTTLLIGSCTLSAAPASILNGLSSVLTWTSANSTSVSINNGIGTVTPTAGGTTSVSPGVSTVYTMTAFGTGGNGTCFATVIVGGPVARPSMNEFWGGFFRQMGGSIRII
jgi:hypothetical protein